MHYYPQPPSTGVKLPKPQTKISLQTYFIRCLLSLLHMVFSHNTTPLTLQTATRAFPAFLCKLCDICCNHRASKPWSHLTSISHQSQTACFLSSVSSSLSTSHRNNTKHIFFSAVLRSWCALQNTALINDWLKTDKWNTVWKILPAVTAWMNKPRKRNNRRRFASN